MTTEARFECRLDRPQGRGLTATLTGEVRSAVTRRVRLNASSRRWQLSSVERVPRSRRLLISTVRDEREPDGLEDVESDVEVERG